MRRYAWMLLALFPNWPGAHVLDEVVQGAYLTLMPGELRLELGITPGVDVVNAIIKTLDQNADQRVSDCEARAYAQHVLEQSAIALDGEAASWILETVSVPPFPTLGLGSATIKIYAVAKRSDSSGAHSLSYENRYQPAESQWTANIFLQPGAGWDYQVTGQQRSDDGRRLSVNYTATRP